MMMGDPLDIPEVHALRAKAARLREERDAQDRALAQGQEAFVEQGVRLVAAEARCARLQHELNDVIPALAHEKSETSFLREARDGWRGYARRSALALRKANDENARLQQALRDVRRLCAEGHGDDLIAATADEALAGPDTPADKGFSEETCVRCGWRMGQPALNCQNDNTPHRFPSQDTPADSPVTKPA